MSQEFRRLSKIELWLPPRGVFAVLISLLLALMLLGVAWLIYETGGIKFVIAHFMYVPIVLAAIFFSWPGGILAGVIAGILTGPYMPLDTATGEMQVTLNWIIRMAFYAGIGWISGLVVGLLVGQLQRLRWVANHTAHTNLPNRVALENKLKERLNANTGAFYFIAFSVDNFDEIAETFGYHATDELIQSIHKRIASAYPAIEFFANHHPQKLGMIVDKDIADKLSEHTSPLMDVMSESFDYQNIPIHVHSTVGYVACSTKDKGKVTEIIQKADVALYHAQQKHTHHIEYDDTMAGDSVETLQFLGKLYDAIQANELVLYYQPKIDLKTLKPMSAECLVRWDSPEFGFVPPGKFIPEAEQTHLIQPLTRWIIDNTFKQMREWKENNLSPNISINLAAKNLTDENLTDFIAAKMDEYGLSPAQIEFEVTESAMLHDPDEAIAFMHQLKGMGFKLSIDDYGSGYASLGYLKDLPVDTLKIDMMFVQNLVKDRDCQEIVKSTITMAHGLGMKTIAEGVEDEAACKMLHDMGCDIGQGYYFAKPLPVNEFVHYFKSA